MEKINLIEILKNCPRDMKLNCTMWEDVTLDSILESNIYPIRIMTPSGLEKLTEYGSYSHDKRAKCVIFPEGKDTWEEFIPPYKFKDGDILTSGSRVFIFKKFHSNGYPKCYCHCEITTKEFKVDTNTYMVCGGNICPATKEQQDILFSEMKVAGYIWNAGTKTLERLKLKFKAGDRIKKKNVNYTYIVTVANFDGEYYNCVDEGGDCFSLCENSDEFELVSKFDIKTLKPFSKVLVRNVNGYWQAQFFMKYDNEIKDYPFKCMSNHWAQCIPFKGNEYLFDTKKDCDEYYKTWEE